MSDIFGGSFPSYGTPGGWQRDKRLFNLFFYGTLGWRAYQNHFQVTGDRGWATGQAFRAVVRWKVWFGTFCVWGLAAFCSTLYAFDPLSIKPMAWYWFVVTWAALPLCQGVTYVLAVDASLFRQRLLYRAFYGLARALRNVPWWVLHMTSMLPWAYIVWAAS